MLVYSISQPSADGEAKGFTRLLTRWGDNNAEWERINSLHTAAIEQAAHDKHLLYYTQGVRHVDLKYPEVFQTGSPINVPAGHYANLDKVVAHYQQLHLAEEEQKAKKLAAAKKEE
ncbi:hypothetical protein GQ53DRAFT_369406 [Thozetella sp. PMI_491]|nr:hypothetical protein GQ53DRAFT_369406 [Thozetella sp. PMI_491]